MLNVLHHHLFNSLWLAWGLYWAYAAFGVKRAVRKESWASWWSHMGPLLVSGYLLGADRLPGGFLCGQAWPSTEGTFWVGAALLAGGLLFSVWARSTLGGNWSGTVTVKQSHELIRSGPYRFVRHPIYTGLLLAFLGSALSRAEWRGVLAIVIVFIALWRKLKLEERWMGETFGDQYDTYKQEVRALVPWLL